MPTWWAKARKSNKKVPAAMRQFLSSDATNVATAVSNSGKTVENTGLFSNSKNEIEIGTRIA
jgi:hypothetical protein